MFRRRKKISSSLVYVLHKTWVLAFSRRSRAVTPAKKCTKKRGARANLMFCLINLLLFLTFSLPWPSSLLNLPTTNSKAAPCYHRSVVAFSYYNKVDKWIQQEAYKSDVTTYDHHVTPAKHASSLMLSGSLFSNNNKVPINHLHSPWPHGELSEERPTFIVQTKIFYRAICH